MGTLSADSVGSLVGGIAEANSIVTSSSGANASYVFGRAASSGIIRGFGESSLVHGTTLNNGQITSRIDTFGSEVSGFSDGGLISVGDNSRGAKVHGHATNNSLIFTQSGCDGSVTSGRANNNSQIFVDTNSDGATARGFVENSGVLFTGVSSHGSEASGQSSSGSRLGAGDFTIGSEAKGLAIGAQIRTSSGSHGSEAKGFAESASLINVGVDSYGSEAKGRSSSGGRITIGFSNIGSEAKGFALGGQIVTTSGAHGSEAKDLLKQVVKLLLVLILLVQKPKDNHLAVLLFLLEHHLLGPLHTV